VLDRGTRVCSFSPLIHEEGHENSRLLLLVKNNMPKKLKKLNVLGKKQSPTRSGMQGLCNGLQVAALKFTIIAKPGHEAASYHWPSA
jgi:hypothetical protein